MINQKDISYFNSQFLENKKFWKRLGGKPNFEKKTVLDFGCGHGALSVEIAQCGAKEITGIDLEDGPLDFAKKNLELNYSNFKENINFSNVDILEKDLEKKFDLIVSKDTFEHTQRLDAVIQKMYDLLKKGGRAYLGFGPLYNFYNGDHGRTRMILPWFHLMVSEKFILNKLNKNSDLKINKIQDLGLSKYSLNEYENFFNNSSFDIKYFKTNLSDHPFAPVFNAMSKIKIFKEYLTYNIYCILEK
jgi:2-polyprenyl-3-methyl-5-hydroxy-6-metoxy-1,4-benzoquinol methylase